MLEFLGADFDAGMFLQTQTSLQNHFLSPLAVQHRLSVSKELLDYHTHPFAIVSELVHSENPIRKTSAVSNQDVAAVLGLRGEGVPHAVCSDQERLFVRRGRLIGVGITAGPDLHGVAEADALEELLDIWHRVQMQVLIELGVRELEVLELLELRDLVGLCVLRESVDHVLDEALLEDQLVVSQGARLVREDVLDLPQVLVDIARLDLWASVDCRVVHAQIPLYESAQEHPDDVYRDVQRYGDHAVVQDQERHKENQQVLLWLVLLEVVADGAHHRKHENYAKEDPQVERHSDLQSTLLEFLHVRVLHQFCVLAGREDHPNHPVGALYVGPAEEDVCYAHFRMLDLSREFDLAFERAQHRTWLARDELCLR